MELLEDISVERQEGILQRLAGRIVKMGLVTPAILLLEVHKPLNFLGSQVLLVLEPFARMVFNYNDYHAFTLMMEKRANVEKLIQKIEILNEEYRIKGKELKVQQKKDKNALRK